MKLPLRSPWHGRARILWLATAVFLLATALLVAAACGSDNNTPEPSSSSSAGTDQSTSEPAATDEQGTSPDEQAGGVATCAVEGADELTGAGATFPFPLYSKWIDEYQQLCGTQINYQSIGSGGGIKQITEQTVDFGASDGIMSDEEQAAAEAAGGPILHIPMTSGAVAVVFNLPGIASGSLHLPADVLGDIYLKKITAWNDPRLAAANPDLALPDTDIAVVHRSDGSGTTFIFTNYLTKVSPEWNDQIGYGKAVDWPGDIGGEGNEGVAGQVRQIEGAIGYVELAYAVQNALPWAAMQNASGNYIEPSLAATTAAAAGIELPDDLKILITNSSNPDAYPISGFTWVLAYVNQPDPATGAALAHYLWWAIHDGQQFATALDYAPLPADVVTKAEHEIEQLNYQGASVLRTE